MKTKNLLQGLILTLLLTLSSCLTGGLMEEPSEGEMKSKGFYLLDMNPEIDEDAGGMNVYYSIQTKDTKTDALFPVTINLLDRNKKPLEGKYSINLNQNKHNLFEGAILTNYVFVPLPEEILKKGGTVYIETVIAEVSLERIQYTYALLTEITPGDWEDGEGNEIEFTPWDPTDPNDPNNPANKSSN